MLSIPSSKYQAVLGSWNARYDVARIAMQRLEIGRPKRCARSAGLVNLPTAAGRTGPGRPEITNYRLSKRYYAHKPCGDDSRRIRTGHAEQSNGASLGIAGRALPSAPTRLRPQFAPVDQPLSLACQGEPTISGT